MVRLGAARRGEIRFATVRYGMVRIFTDGRDLFLACRLSHGTVRQDGARLGMARCGMARPGVVCSGGVRVIPVGEIDFSPVGFIRVWLGEVWRDLVWRGTARCGQIGVGITDR